MCGIAGILRRDGAPASRQTLEWMNSVQSHRGPDGHDVFCEGPVGLAHRRLAIIDLSEAGLQPMTVEGRTVVYNGEIYNFRELRAELEVLGHRFSSESDTEVLLRAYLQWGKACVNRFNGMFAFALWDASQGLLFCARDRLGIKPFFYVEDEAGLEFASEIKALLHRPERRKPRLRTLVRFLGEGLTDDEWETFFEGVSILPPAHTLTVSQGRSVLERYWRVRPELDWQEVIGQAALEPRAFPGRLERTVDDSYFPRVQGLQEAAEAFRALLQDSVRLRLRSDVPVGTCLSGGLDSSSVVACASSLLDRPMETFSSIYPDRGYDEKRYIDDVVSAYETVPNPVQPDGEDLPELFDRIVWHQDEPTGGPGLYSQWRVMQTARSKVTVLLDGQGGDELLAGYHHYFREYLSELAMELHAEGKPLDQVLRQAETIGLVTGHDHGGLADRAIRRARRPKILKLFQRERPGKVKTPAVLHRALASSVSSRDATRMDVDRLFSNSLSQKLHDDLTRFSIPALLRYEDRNSMAFSLEARVPFLDHRLVELCFAMPTRLKIAPPLTKLVLRKAMNGRLPASVTQRQDKLGYPTPVANWFRQGLKAWVEDLLTSSSFRGCDLLDTAACLAVWQDHLGGSDRSWDLWRILHTYRWSELFLKGQGFSALDAGGRVLAPGRP
jgi:asparagine synthase (glutamine-hydrolysing)